MTTLLAMTIPDDPAELARWLERRLLAPDFGRFVAELSALQHPATDPLPRPQVDRWLAVALTHGLDSLPADALRQLLRHPKALADFQERIVTDGGAYWDDVADQSDDLTRSFEAGKSALDHLFAARSPKAMPKSTAKPTSAAVVPSEIARRTEPRAYKWLAAMSSGVAACLAVAVGYLAVRGPGEKPFVLKAQVAWGWDKPGGLPNSDSPKEYLTKLAATAEEWTNYRPTDAVGVGVRLAEFRSGCTRLMHSPYGPLNPEDKAWLLQNCRAWAKKLDEHHQALDAGADPVQVRTAVDETVTLITTTLREKAKQVG